MASALTNRCLANAVIAQDMTQARADCATAERLAPGDAAVRINLGLIELKQGQYAKAVTEYDAALAIDPQRARAYYGRGLARLKLGNVTGGNVDLQTAKGMLPSVAEEFARYGVKGQ